MSLAIFPEQHGAIPKWSNYHDNGYICSINFIITIFIDIFYEFKIPSLAFVSSVVVHLDFLYYFIIMPPAMDSVFFASIKFNYVRINSTNNPLLFGFFMQSFRFAPEYLQNEQKSIKFKFKWCVYLAYHHFLLQIIGDNFSGLRLWQIFTFQFVN